jgi:RimJ/RimL family protein N-acetyltransferase
MQERLLDYAAGLGLNEVWGLIDDENRKGLNLAEKLGFTPGFVAGLPFVRVVKALG